MLIFVYGTLLKGLENSHLLQGSTFKFSAITVDSFFMISNENNGIPSANTYEPSEQLDAQVEKYPYPYLMKSGVNPSHTASQIIGEVYEVSDEVLQKLDVLEDHPATYLRQPVKVLPTSDIDEEVPEGVIEGYVLESSVVVEDIRANMQTGRYQIVEGGSWMSHVKK